MFDYARKDFTLLGIPQRHEIEANGVNAVVEIPPRGRLIEEDPLSIGRNHGTVGLGLGHLLGGSMYLPEGVAQHSGESQRLRRDLDIGVVPRSMWQRTLGLGCNLPRSDLEGVLREHSLLIC